MIHEALISLWDCGQDLFNTISEEEWLNNIDVHEFLHPSEKQLLGKIMDVALMYHKIEAFRKMIMNQNMGQNCKLYVITNGQDTLADQDFSKGLYLKAFCHGVNEALQGYRNEIIAIEEKFLNNPSLSLNFVLGAVMKYSMLFEMLTNMINVIHTEKIYGALLLGRLHSYKRCKITLISDATLNITQSVNTVFYHHLCNWIIYGDLALDQYKEFFIADGNCADENFEYERRIEESSTSIETSQVQRKNRNARFSIRKFYIRTEMLPSIIGRNAAEMILFVGRVVWIIRNEPTNAVDDGMTLKRDVWDGNDLQYYLKIKELGNYHYDFETFEHTIEHCRLKLTKYLWKVMVEEAQLLTHLQHVRDYYALGRGELFQHFIVSAGNRLKETPNRYIVKNLNFIFTETATKMYGEFDKSFRKFELAIVNSSEAGDNPWTKLKLNFDIVWPLHVIFHPKMIDLYNRLFRFLLMVTQTHIELNKLWQVHISSKKNINRRVFTLRHNLMFLVNNLQYYLQVDVIEAEFSLLKKAIQTVNEFEDIIHLHSKFVGNLLSKTFLMTLNDDSSDHNRHNLYQVPSLNYTGKNTMYSIIYLLLELCDEFCTMAYTWNVELTESELKDLESIEQRANNLNDMLLRVLNNIHQKMSGSHILQLLYRLDFNNWYSKSKSDFNLSIA